MTTDDAIVRLPPDLRARCEDRIEGTNFDSVEEYVQFVVSQLVDADVERDEAVTSRDDSEAVTERLEGLGYL